MADPVLFESRMLSVDVYMAQHPGVPGRQSSQSVWGHLIGLYLVFERGYDGIASARAKARVATPEATFASLREGLFGGDLWVFTLATVGRARSQAMASSPSEWP